ncbi:MAG: bifunctional o-acetylhomoserine/o-acetylserine sulfhydrylase [Microthrixaceae bacterium]
MGVRCRANRHEPFAANAATEGTYMSDNWGFDTRQIHAGADSDATTGARATPIYQTTAYQFRDSDHAANLFALSEIGNIYTRIMNPTQGVVEARVASLEGAPDTAVGLPGALVVSSGQSATTLAILNLAEAGSHIVASAALYGGTYNLFRYTLPKLGVQVSFVDDPDDLDAWASEVRPETKAFFAETIGNPKNDVLDIEGVAGVAHANGVPLIVDNTVATPYLIQPLRHGADIVVHSATKFLGGHGTAIAGVIVDGGSFDFSQNDKFPQFTEPDPSYNGLQYWPALGAGSYIIKARVQLLRDMGNAISPFNAFLLIQGIETLSLRMERHVSNAQQVAEYLAAHDQVESVAYSGLPSSKWHGRLAKYAPKGAGSVPAFVIKGGREAGRAFVEALELHSHVANLGDVRSLVVHPASTTHSQLTEDEQRAAAVEPGLVRLSVGIESIEDILADLDKGFAAAAAAG